MVGLGGYSRYAIYWAPERGSWLEAFGASWLGRDAEAGEARMRPRLDPDLVLETLTAAPARYGFHATLKPPFRLAEGVGAADLDRELAAFAAETAPAEAPALEACAHLGFVALCPSGPAPALDALALAVVRRFERFRGPPDAAERARRQALGLSARQREMLETYGYPFVGPEFRFHATLTGRIEPQLAAQVVATVTPLVAPHLDDPFRLDEISLFGDPGEEAPFRLLRRYRLAA